MEIHDVNGDFIYDHDKVKDHWRNEFKNLLTPPPQEYDLYRHERLAHIRDEISKEEDSFIVYDDDTREILDPLNVPFKESEVEYAIKKARKGRAPGIDGLLMDTFRNKPSIKLMTTLFNACKDTKLMPEAWSKAIIYPIPKSSVSDPCIPMSYRGISLLPTSSKLFTSCIANRLSNHFETKDILANEQNGFRPNRSCLDHIFTLVNLCTVRRCLKTDTFLSFIDFKKAFDYVNHDYLFYKLIKAGIKGDIYYAIRNIYRQPSSCIQINGELTEWFEVTAGVRQGDSLSPILFALFINDLVLELKEIEAAVYIGGQQLPILLYADDIVLISPDIHKAQAQLNVLNEWCVKWDMKVNIDKSNIMHVRNHQKSRYEILVNCGNESLSYARTYKYLGFIVHECLSMDDNVVALTSAASRSFGRIVNMFKSLGNMGIKTYNTLFENYVLPIMNYAAGVWGFKDYADPQTLLNRIACYCLGVHKFHRYQQ